MATKDRSKTFQFVTLALFSFCSTIILLSSFARLSAVEKQRQSYKVNRQAGEAGYASYATNPSYHLLGLKK
jgi:hypothetical protein